MTREAAERVLCQNPAHALTWCFRLALVLIRLIYLFVARVFGWLVLTASCPGTARG